MCPGEPHRRRPGEFETTDRSTELLAALVDEAAANGYELQLSTPLADEDPVASYERAILAKRVDGFVIDCLRPAIDHLVGLGHRRIGCLAEPLEYVISARRHESFHRAMKAHDLDVDPDHIVINGWREDAGVEAAGRLLDRQDPPTALVAFNDLLAFGALRAAATRGIDVPDRLSIVGFDDVHAAGRSGGRLRGRPHAGADRAALDGGRDRSARIAVARGTWTLSSNECARTALAGGDCRVVFRCQALRGGLGGAVGLMVWRTSIRASS